MAVFDGLSENAKGMVSIHTWDDPNIPICDYVFEHVDIEIGPNLQEASDT